MHERVAQDLLGHADSRTTREIYTHVSEQMMGDAVHAITDAVGGVIGEHAAANGPPDRDSGANADEEDESVGG